MGGGGIPVTRSNDGSLKGRDAVIDKDHASSLLASRLKAEILFIATVVDKVFLIFGTDDAKPWAP
jgi:carbamate kinase